MQRTDIVIFEDDPLVGALSCELLKDAGYSVLLVENSHGAVQAIKAAMPKLLILDIMMPGVSGLDICKMVKTDPSIRHIKILVVSGKAYAVEKRRALKFGVDCFLKKPFNEKTYINTVKSILAGTAPPISGHWD